MPNYNGQLRPNEVFAAIYNMIISQQVFSGNIKGTKSTLVDMARVDGSLYGDTKLYYSTDALYSSEWGKDAEAANLLNLYRPESPKCQAIYLDVFRQICLTVDNYLTKRAWSTEDAFQSFNSVMLGWMRDTKRVYDSSIYNTYIGTTETDIGRQTIEIDLTTALNGLNGEEKARVKAGVIGEAMAKLLTDLEDFSRDFNDYGQLRSYDIGELKFIWNSDVVAGIEKRDLPITFHKDFIDKFAQYTLPARYFGDVNGTDVTTSDGTTIRSLTEQIVQDTSGKSFHVFAGDIIPANVKLVDGGKVIVPSYTQNSNILFKVIHEDSVPYMSAFETQTSFFNPKSLTETNYLTFGHNTLEYLKGKPFITVKSK